MTQTLCINRDPDRVFQETGIYALLLVTYWATDLTPMSVKNWLRLIQRKVI